MKKALMNWLPPLYHLLLSLYANKYSSKYFVFQKFEAYKLKKYYKNIDEMPMYLWLKISKHTSLIYLSKTGSICWRARTIYDNISDEIIDTFGIDDKYLQILANETKIEMYRLNMQRTGDRTNLVHIRLLTMMNDKLRKTQKETDLHSSVFVYNQKGLVNLDFKTITISQHFNAQNLLIKQHAAEKAAHDKANKK